PLDANRSCIRLIKLRRGTTDDPLICNFLVVSLKDKPAYDTLSYPWGDDNMTKTILVDNVTFEITVNLEEFLRCLRSPNADLVLWADALCIDQQNGREKSTQIGLMAQIYRQGKENHIWFGDFTHSWKDEILSDPLYVPTSQFTEVIRWPTIVDSLRWIISRPWWSRVWTLQEAILPRVDSLVHIGSS
ncbi:heterokaryon incompatibility protein-domain-containing protein, partial [Truncatella angustata]